MQTGYQLYHLFVTILKDCVPADPRALWNTFWPHIYDDLKYYLREHVFRNRDIKPLKAQIQDYGLYLIDYLLEQSGKRLSDWPSMPQVVNNWDAHIADQNSLIAKQRQYGLKEQAGLVAQCIANLNANQHFAFDRITAAITGKIRKTFFLYGPGGTGKTYLYNTLCHYLHSQNKIVVCVASFGIAALLLNGGHTAHSHLKIPVPYNETTFCTKARNSHLASLICQTDLVIWNEAPMQHCHIMETVDRFFRDWCDSDKPFSGLTIVFSGNF
jgi:PIF1-like helicase